MKHNAFLLLTPLYCGLYYPMVSRIGASLSLCQSLYAKLQDKKMAERLRVCTSLAKGLISVPRACVERFMTLFVTLALGNLLLWALAYTVNSPSFSLSLPLSINRQKHFKMLYRKICRFTYVR